MPSILATLPSLLALLQAPMPIYTPGRLTEHQARARELLQQLIEINTGVTTGDITIAAKAMADRFREAGIPDPDIFVDGPVPNKHNVVARLRGTGGPNGPKPLLLLAHLDVVEAKKEDWSPDLDPFRLNEKDGYYFGRGVIDDKAMAAIFVANLFRLKQEGFRPSRDIIFAFTADEESGSHNGVRWLLENHRGLVDAGIVINEGAIGYARGGKYSMQTVEAAQKNTTNYTLRVTNRGGHSSVPRDDNAIYALARALLAVSAYRFPVQLNEVTRESLKQTANLEPPEMARAMRALADNARDTMAARIVSANPAHNAILRTVCVATMLGGGHATNALPQLAEANVNCRLYPTDTAEAVRDSLARAIGDTTVQVVIRSKLPPAPLSTLSEEVMEPIRRITRELFGDIPVIPVMATGATDSRTFRAAGIPAYGVSGIFVDPSVEIGAHGRDERISVKSFFEAQEFLHRLTKALSSPGAVP
jgi:acetylornithine deacetylase/succinyl-diaminopimelate desuccinylase-like protein